MSIEKDLEDQIAMLGMDFGQPDLGVVPQVQQPVQQAPVQVPVQVPVQPSIQQVPVQQVQQAPTPFTHQVQQPVQQPIQQPVQQAPMQQPVQQPMQQPMQQAQPELVFVNLAKSTFSTETAFFKVKEGEWSRITLLGLDKALMLKLHYLDGIGFVKCHSTYKENGWIETPAECCQMKTIVNGVPVFTDRVDENGKKSFAKTRYLLPIVEYPVDPQNANKLLQGQVPQLKIWNLNTIEMDNLREAIKACAEDPNDLSTANFSSLDFKVTKSKNAMGFPMNSVTVSPNSFRSTYDAHINAEFSKVTNDYLLTALKESRKDYPIEKIVEYYDAKRAQELAVQTAINNQFTPAGLELPY